jgi:FkbM family methyltransferase
VQWVIYDANDEALSSVAKCQDKNVLLVNNCIGASNSKGKFHVTVEPTASSMLKPALSSFKYTFDQIVWGEHARVVESNDIEIRTIDSLVEESQLPYADFLSIDAQGAELDIINGASRMLKSTVVGIICEVEFTAVYEGQPLFCDTQDRLRRDNFRFCQISSEQYWNTGLYVKELQGAGFFTVGEALFLKDTDILDNIENLRCLSEKMLTEKIVYYLKLAAVAVVFDQLDYAIGILQPLQMHNFLSLDELANSTDVKYVKILRDLMNAVETFPPGVAETFPFNYNLSNERDKINGRRGIKNLLHNITPPVLWKFARKLVKGDTTKIEDDKIDKIYLNYGLYGLLRNKRERKGIGRRDG